MYNLASKLPKIRAILPNTAVDSTADTISISSYFTAPESQISLMCLSGNLWVNPVATASTANGFKLTAGQSVEFSFAGSFSVVSDAVGANFQGIFWE